jgi:hypothetical protein
VQVEHPTKCNQSENKITEEYAKASSLNNRSDMNTNFVLSERKQENYPFIHPYYIYTIEEKHNEYLSTVIIIISFF